MFPAFPALKVSRAPVGDRLGQGIEREERRIEDFTPVRAGAVCGGAPDEFDPVGPAPAWQVDLREMGGIGEAAPGFLGQFAHGRCHRIFARGQPTARQHPLVAGMIAVADEQDAWEPPIAGRALHGDNLTPAHHGPRLPPPGQPHPVGKTQNPAMQGGRKQGGNRAGHDPMLGGARGERNRNRAIAARRPRALALGSKGQWE